VGADYLSLVGVEGELGGGLVRVVLTPTEVIPQPDSHWRHMCVAHRTRRHLLASVVPHNVELGAACVPLAAHWWGL
jgi:hypothetical protein